MAFTNPYSTQSAPATYNQDPPSDDGSPTAANTTKWTDQVVGKIGGPLKTFSESINSAIVTMGTKVINTDADVNNSFAGSLAYTSSALTLSSGAVTGTRAYHVIAAESGTSDDFDTLTATNYSTGDLVYLQADSGDLIYVTTAGNFAHPCLLYDNKPLPFMYDGTNWQLLATGLILLDYQAPSAVANVDFTKGISSVYDAYVLQLTGFRPAVSTDDLWLRISDDGGSTFKSGATDYEYSVAIMTTAAGGFSGSANSTGAAQIQLTDSQGADAGEGANGEIKFGDVSTSRLMHQFHAELTFGDSTATPVPHFNESIGSHNASALAINALQLRFSTGNIAAGVGRLFAVMGSGYVP